MDTRWRGRKTDPIIAPFHGNRRVPRLLHGSVGILIRTPDRSPALDAGNWLVMLIRPLQRFSTTAASSGTAGRERWRMWEPLGQMPCRREPHREPMPPASVQRNQPPLYGLGSLLRFGRVGVRNLVRNLVRNFVRNLRGQLPDEKFLKQIGRGTCANPNGRVFES